MHATSSYQKCTQAQLAEKRHENIMHAYTRPERKNTQSTPPPKKSNSPPLAMADPELELGERERESVFWLALLAFPPSAIFFCFTPIKEEGALPLGPLPRSATALS